MKIRILEAAREDLKAGFEFYESQAPGLGEYFLDSIQGDVKSLKIFAGIHEKANGFFRMLAKRFPFAIYYLINNNTINIYAILDCRKDPGWIAKRIKSAQKP